MPQKILIIDDEADVHYSFKRLFEDASLTVLAASNSGDGLRLLKKEKPDVVVMDIRMGAENGLATLREIRRVDPKQVVIMMTAYGTSQTAIEAMKLGAFDYVLKPFDIEALKQLLKRALTTAQTMREVVRVSVAAAGEDGGSGIVGQSAAMQAVYKLIGQVAPTDATILITGESGTGKELVARAIYSHSQRSQQTYLAINCASIPEPLLESELFGHERGSFTGAALQRIGKFEQCNGGTIFLDEIGDMPLTLQAKILRVLQDGEIFRVGSNTPIQTDVRILAATHQDLSEAVKKKLFREDLYYRLNVIHLTIPPLRERPEDVPSLVAYFLKKWKSHRKGAPMKVAQDAMERLKAYRWRGNVRELENCVQRAMVMATGDTIRLKDLPPDIASAPLGAVISTPVAGEAQSALSLPEILRALFEHTQQNSRFRLLPAVEAELIAYALEQTHGNQVQAAKLLGISRATLRKRVEKFGFSKQTKIERE